jgi:integrase/recombinase XerC
VGRVLLLTFRYTGLRLSELVTLRTDEVDLEARRISLVGKGRKPRVIPIPHLLADVLREYRETLRPSLPGSAYLFANPNGNRSLRGRYGPRALHNLVVEAGTSAGVAGRHFAHRWRHSYATSLVRRGEDIHVVQRLTGLPELVGIFCDPRSHQGRSARDVRFQELECCRHTST